MASWTISGGGRWGPAGGAGAAGAGCGAAAGATARPSTPTTSANPKSWSTRSLNVSSQPVWSSSGGGGGSSRRRRRSGRTFRQPDAVAGTRRDAGAEIRVQHALDAGRVLLARDQQHALGDHLEAERLAREVRLEPRRQRQHDDVREDRAVERRQHGDAEAGTDRGDVGAGEVPQ